MQKFAVLSGFVSTNAGGDFYPGVRREPRFLTPSRLLGSNLPHAGWGPPNGIGRHSAAVSRAGAKERESS